MLFWTALKLTATTCMKKPSFRDVLFWTALKHLQEEEGVWISFRDVLFWTALKLGNVPNAAAGVF